MFFKTLIRQISLSLEFFRGITLFWMCYDENMLDFSFRYSFICYRMSSCTLKSWSYVSSDTFSSLDDESIIILCCLSWYVSLKCWIYYSSCLIILYHCSWNIFSFLAKESINIVCCLQINILCYFLWYFSLKLCIYYSSCLILWYHCYWNSFSSMAKE